MYQEIKELKDKIQRLEDDVARMKRSYGDTLENIDMDNVSETLLEEIIKRTGKSGVFLDSNNGVIFKVVKNEDTGVVSVHLDGLILGYIQDNKFVASTTFDFSNHSPIIP